MRLRLCALPKGSSIPHNRVTTFTLNGNRFLTPVHRQAFGLGRNIALFQREPKHQTIKPN